jgi:hypothetical protein
VGTRDHVPSSILGAAAEKTSLPTLFAQRRLAALNTTEMIPPSSSRAQVSSCMLVPTESEFNNAMRTTTQAEEKDMPNPLFLRLIGAHNSRGLYFCSSS